MEYHSKKKKSILNFLFLVEEKELSYEERIVPVLEYNPALNFVKELNQSFHNIAKFYYDKYGGSVIGVKVDKVCVNVFLGLKFALCNLPIDFIYFLYSDFSKVRFHSKKISYSYHYIY